MRSGATNKKQKTLSDIKVEQSLLSHKTSYILFFIILVLLGAFLFWVINSEYGETFISDNQNKIDLVQKNLQTNAKLNTIANNLDPDSASKEPLGEPDDS